MAEAAERKYPNDEGVCSVSKINDCILNILVEHKRYKECLTVFDRLLYWPEGNVLLNYNLYVVWK